MLMDWSNLLTAERLRPKQTPDAENGRSHFEKDLDRIVFCSTFRRLGKKTQVYPLAENDNVHTRLMHSLEVANVGRALGRTCAKTIRSREPKLCDNAIQRVSQIVQAACLAHDIGNPPFGHAGEFAIRHWFSSPENEPFLKDLSHREQRDFHNFDGNAQTFRILTKVEGRRPNEGMRLTCATLAAVLKYPWTSSEISKHDTKFSVYQSDVDDFRAIAAKVGLIRRGRDMFSRHPLAYLVEAADDICNRIMDLEDACEMKLITLDEILNILNKCANYDGEYDKVIKDNDLPPRYKAAYIRAKAIGYAIEKVAITFEMLYDRIMDGSLDPHLNLVQETKPLAKQLNDAEELIEKKVFSQRRKTELELGGYSTLSKLLDMFCFAVKEQFDYERRGNKELSFKTKRVMNLLANRTLGLKAASLYDSYLIVIDYISGMTDDYARFLAQQFIVQQNR